MGLIKQTIENFITMYDEVIENMSDKPEPVLHVSTPEVRAYAQTLKPRFNSRNDDRSRNHKKN